MVVRVVAKRMTRRIVVASRLNSLTSSVVETPADALAMICSRWSGVKLGPRRLFPEISAPNCRRGGIVV